MDLPWHFGGRVQSVNFQQEMTIVPSGVRAGSAHGGMVEMKICLSGERCWETHSGAPYEPEFDRAPEWSDEVDAQSSAHSEDEEDSEDFLSPDWD